MDGVSVDTDTGSAIGVAWESLGVGARVGTGTTYANNAATTLILDSPCYWNTVPATWAEVEYIIAQRYAQGRGREYGNSVGYTCYGKLTSATGSKLTTALEYSREYTTNQNPIGLQFDAYVPGLLE